MVHLWPRGIFARCPHSSLLALREDTPRWLEVCAREAQHGGRRLSGRRPARQQQAAAAAAQNARRHPELKLNTPPQFFCTSRCPDFEFRGTSLCTHFTQGALDAEDML